MKDYVHKINEYYITEKGSIYKLDKNGNKKYMSIADVPVDVAEDASELGFMWAVDKANERKHKDDKKIAPIKDQIIKLIK